MIDESLLRVCISSDVAEALPWFPAQRDCAFVYLIHSYGLQEGLDVAVWTKATSGPCMRRAFATGPLTLRLPELDLEALLLGTDESIPRRERLIKAIEDLPLTRNLQRDLAALADPLVDEEVEISLSEFETALTLALSARSGSYAVLGGDGTSVRLVVATPTEHFDVNSWTGTGDPQTTWKAFHQLLRMARIEDLELREFD